MTYLQNFAVASALAVILASSAAFADDKKRTDMNENNYKYSTSSQWTEGEQYEALVKRVKENMSDNQKAYWTSMDGKEQEAWMEKAVMREKRLMKIGKKYEISDMNAEAMKVNDTIGEILQADAEPDVQSDRELLMSEGHQFTKSELVTKESDSNAYNNTIVVPTISSEAVTTVACPIGTTAQPDMTCLVTGDYEPNS